jgi:hypothetical protein
LGYYSRNLSRIGIGALRIVVRRFRCRACRKTASLLPAFVQPYRFVQNGTIENYVRGDPLPDEVTRHLDLLAQYWKRFCRWLPEIKRTLGHVSLFMGRYFHYGPIASMGISLAAGALTFIVFGGICHLLGK